MKKMSRLGCAALVAGGVLGLGAVAPANAEPAGQYDYYCTGVDGLQRSWNTSPRASCNGWLDVYIGGKRIAHLNNNNAYIRRQLSNPNGPHVTVECVLSATGLYLTIPLTLTVVGVVATALAAYEFGLNCLSTPNGPVAPVVL